MAPQYFLRLFHILAIGSLVSITCTRTAVAWIPSPLSTATRRSSNAIARMETTKRQRLQLLTTTVSGRGCSHRRKIFSPLAVVSDLTQNGVAAPAEDENMPELGKEGIYHVSNKKEHAALLDKFSDKIVILKVFAPWCRACKGLEPKFQALVDDDKYKSLPIVWADLSIQHNKDFVKNLGVLALPTIQIYIGHALAENFPCGPSKIAILKRKIAQTVNEHVNANTLELKEDSLRLAQTKRIPIPTADVDSGDASMEGDEEGQDSETGVKKIRIQQPVLINGKNVTAETPPIEELSAASAAAAAATHAEELQKSKTAAAADTTTLTPVLIPQEERNMMRRSIPYFADMSLADLDAVFDKARILKFEAGSVIIRQGKNGRTFYVLKEGEVEILQKAAAASMFADPLLATPPNYLGAVINRLQPNDYFGERSLITAEPRAASIRAVTTVTAWAFDQSDFPASSILSGKTKFDVDDAAADALEDKATNGYLSSVNDKYGVSLSDLFDREMSQQLRDVTAANQIRGSVNTPEIIRGVDTDEDYLQAMALEDDEEEEEEDKPEMLTISSTTGDALVVKDDDAIFALLTRFQRIRTVSRCLDYIVQTRAVWGDAGIRKRRSLLVQRLTKSQRAEFRETFGLMDQNDDGYVSLLELKRVIESIGETKSDAELMEMIGNDGVVDASNAKLNLEDFMGIMAEAEFYHLFRDIFSAMDQNQSGFVKAGALHRVLSGVRDLISDDRKSIIDVDDEDMLIDYEHFSRMLLGTALI